MDFTYISKLENGHFPPPSEETLLRIAQACQCTQQQTDRLFVEARRIPSDVIEYLFDHPDLMLRIVDVVRHRQIQAREAANKTAPDQ